MPAETSSSLTKNNKCSPTVHAVVLLKKTKIWTDVFYCTCINMIKAVCSISWHHLLWPHHKYKTRLEKSELRLQWLFLQVFPPVVLIADLWLWLILKWKLVSWKIMVFSSITVPKSKIRKKICYGTLRCKYCQLNLTENHCQFHTERPSLSTMQWTWCSLSSADESCLKTETCLYSKLSNKLIQCICKELTSNSISLSCNSWTSFDLHFINIKIIIILHPAISVAP